MNTPPRVLPVLLLLALVACTTPLADKTRVHLGGASFLELSLPVGWEFRPVFGETPTAERVRVFNGATEVMQVMPIRWSGNRVHLDSSLMHLRERAASVVTDRGLCKGLAQQERALPEGIATYCVVKAQDGNERVHGVLANGRMTAAFSFIHRQGESPESLWRILGTVKHLSLENAA